MKRVKVAEMLRKCAGRPDSIPCPCNQTARSFTYGAEDSVSLAGDWRRFLRRCAYIAESIAYAQPPREGFDPLFYPDDGTGTLVQSNDPDDVAEAMDADRRALCR